MEITEAKIRQISTEALRYLGPQADPLMLKKVVKEVIRRLIDETNGKRTHVERKSS